VAGKKNYWDTNVSRRKFLLEIESTQSRKPDIQHKTTRNIGRLSAEKAIRRLKGFSLQPHGAQKELERGTYRWIVVYNKNQGSRGHEGPSPAGSVNENTAP
jgi:hypothetical protein